MKARISPKKASLRTINSKYEGILADIQEQQKLLVALKKEALQMAKRERQNAKKLASRKPAKKGRRKATRQSLALVREPFKTQPKSRVFH
jgi:hypothetical protein